MLSARAHATTGLSALILITLVVPGIVPASMRGASRGRCRPPTSRPSKVRASARRLSAPGSLISTLQPGYVVIGDSMAGTRIDERRLIELTGTQVAPLLQPGSGSAFWYLALKNSVIAAASGPG